VSDRLIIREEKSLQEGGEVNLIKDYEDRKKVTYTAISIKTNEDCPF